MTEHQIVSLAVGFGFCLGLIVGVALAAIGQGSIDDQTAKTGIFSNRGKGYSLTEIPQQKGDK